MQLVVVWAGSGLYFLPGRKFDVYQVRFSTKLHWHFFLNCRMKGGIIACVGYSENERPGLWQKAVN